MASKQYTKLNFIAFSLSCFFNISFMVFLSSTQSFFLRDILGISTKIGNYIGTLGFADELISISLSPFLGALSDKIGAKVIQVFGIFIIGLSFFIFTFAKNVYPDLLLIRMLFAIGATAAGSMMTALLAELSTSGFKLSSFLKSPVVNDPIEQEDDYDDDDDEDSQVDLVDSGAKKNGKLTSVIGISSGLGALFAVSIYLPLPNKFGETESPSLALKHSYFTVGSIAILASIFLSYGLFSSKNFKIPIIGRYISSYDDALTNLENEIEQDIFHVDQETTQDNSYFHTLKLGFLEAKNPKIALAYFGGFLARSTTIISAVFIPLYVNKYYYSTGICSRDDDDQAGGKGCREAYIQAAILTGILHLCSLIFAPLIGMIVDKIGSVYTLLISCIFGIISNLGFAIFDNPKSINIVLMCCLFGISEIGIILTSMSLCTDKKREYNGAISGVYSLVGGLGILIISKLGGFFADYWIGSPFIILGIFQIIMVIVGLSVKEKVDRVEL